jgi:hypothetical protein
LRQVLGLVQESLKRLDGFAQEGEALLQSRKALRHLLGPGSSRPRQCRAESDGTAKQHRDDGKRRERLRDMQPFEHAHDRLQHQVQHQSKYDRENNLSSEIACGKQHQNKLPGLKHGPDIRRLCRLGQLFWFDIGLQRMRRFHHGPLQQPEMLGFSATCVLGSVASEAERHSGTIKPAAVVITPAAHIASLPARDPRPFTGE